MKRILTLVLLFCLLLSVLPCRAEEGYLGNMEIVNCKEWVSLREKPGTSAKRLAKVPLGAVVTHCRRHGNGWIYGQYDEHEGYIQSKYLQQCEGMSVYSAMLVSAFEDSIDLYESMGALESSHVIPSGAIVRSCAVMASGRAYVEYGSRTGYVDAEQLEPYTELLHFPRQITLRRSPFVTDPEASAPALRVIDAEAFHLAEYDYAEYDFTEFEPVDEDTPLAKFVLYADSAVKNVHLFSVALRYVDVELGDEIYDFTLEHIQAQMDPEHPLSVTAVIYGDSPNLAVGYEDWTGAYHFAFVEISGADASFLLRPF